MAYTQIQQLELDLAALGRLLDTGYLTSAQYNEIRQGLLMPLVGFIDMKQAARPAQEAQGAAGAQQTKESR